MPSVSRREYQFHEIIMILVKTRGLTDEHREVVSSSVPNDKQYPKPGRAMFGYRFEIVTTDDVVPSSGSYMG